MRVLVIDKCNDDIPIFGILCLPGQDEIPITDSCINHGHTVCPYDIEASSAKQGDRQLHICLDLLLFQERSATGNRSEDCHICHLRAGLFSLVRYDLPPIVPDQPLILHGDQILVSSSAGNPDSISNFRRGRRTAAGKIKILSIILDRLHDDFGS